MGAINPGMFSPCGSLTRYLSLTSVRAVRYSTASTLFLLLLASDLFAHNSRAPQRDGPRTSFGLESDFDPLSLTEALNEGLSSADLEAQNAATKLRHMAKAWLEERFQELSGEEHLYEREQFINSVKQGHCRFEDKTFGLGEVKVTSIDDDYVFKINLNRQKFPNASKVEFLVFDMESLRPDPKRLEILLTTFNAVGELEDKTAKALANDPEALEAFIVKVAERDGLSEVEIRNYLAASSAHLRKYIARLLLQSDVQAIGLNGDDIALAFFGKKRSIFHFQQWMRTWWEAMKSPVTTGRVMLGVVCGSIQGAATYYFATERLRDVAASGGDHYSLLPIVVIPAAVTAWSFSYGVGLAAINGFYRNFTYSGSTGARIFKLSIFGAAFAAVYNVLADPMELVTVAGLTHMAVNIGLNQYAKDDAYRISRYRESLQLNTQSWNIKVIPDWLRTAFPKLFAKIPGSFEMKQADVETQGSYHVLWAFKMLHFTHLASWTVLPAAIVVARGLAWSYTKYLQVKLRNEYKTSPTPERKRALEATNSHIRDLKKSWFDLYYLSRDAAVKSWWLIRSAARLSKYAATRDRQYLEEVFHEKANASASADGKCSKTFAGQTFFPNRPL